MTLTVTGVGSRSGVNSHLSQTTTAGNTSGPGTGKYFFFNETKEKDIIKLRCSLKIEVKNFNKNFKIMLYYVILYWFVYLITFNKHVMNDWVCSKQRSKKKKMKIPTHTCYTYCTYPLVYLPCFCSACYANTTINCLLPLTLWTLASLHVGVLHTLTDPR